MRGAYYIRSKSSPRKKGQTLSSTSRQNCGLFVQFCSLRARPYPCNLAPVTNLNDFFGDESPLKKLLPGFQPRAGQAWMAEAVAETIANLDKLVVEAGTGTGKTFAYLLPALQSGRKTIISTGTKALQDQLYHRDLPLIGKAVGRLVSPEHEVTIHRCPR